MKERFDKICTHCRIHVGLAVTHGVAAALTGKPEIYGPIAALYALAAVKDALGGHEA